MILTADWHLTDRPEDDYRWEAFDALNRLLEETGPQQVCLMGDFSDRKDRHSSTLVNGVVQALDRLHKNANALWVIMGNHDKPLKGTPFWNLLNWVDARRVVYCDEPHEIGNGVILLPYAHDPASAWEAIDFRRFRLALMHQPVKGVIGENGYVVQGSSLPLFPRGLKIYSGDIHTPQRVGRVEYVGAPHHVKFGDSYKCRMLVLDDERFEIEREYILTPPAKTLITLNSIAELDLIAVRPGDQVKVRLSLQASAAEDWAADERKVHDWARAHGVRVSSLETQVIAADGQAGTPLDPDSDPHAILDAFMASEGIEDYRVGVGHALLKEAITDA